jgi:hypothetical protein
LTPNRIAVDVALAGHPFLHREPSLVGDRRRHPPGESVGIHRDGLLQRASIRLLSA